MKQIGDMSLQELAAFVCDHLANKGIHVVLTGGACVTLYTENRYQSLDIDLVNMDGVGISQIAGALLEIGFIEKGLLFEHPDSDFTIDILAPPLSLGSSGVHEVSEMEIGGHRLRCLSPTDSVCDRLAAWFFWDDEQALEQALLICMSQHVNLDAVRSWAESEGESENCTFFVRMVQDR